MSIEDFIRFRVSEGRLYPLLPRAPGLAPVRAMLVSTEIWSLLSADHEDEEMEERLGILQADLETFVTGRPIDPKYLFLLYPSSEAVWEIRSVRANPSMRVLGLFAKRDVFIATCIALRENLGGWESREWKNVKRAARSEWNNLLHTYQPIISTNVSDLVTDAIDGKYFKKA